MWDTAKKMVNKRASLWIKSSNTEGNLFWNVLFLCLNSTRQKLFVPFLDVTSTFWTKNFHEDETRFSRSTAHTLGRETAETLIKGDGSLTVGSVALLCQRSLCVCGLDVLRDVMCSYSSARQTTVSRWILTVPGCWRFRPIITWTGEVECVFMFMILLTSTYDACNKKQRFVAFVVWHANRSVLTFRVILWRAWRQSFPWFSLTHESGFSG